MTVLNDREIVALLNLARDKGVVQSDRVAAIDSLLGELTHADGDERAKSGVLGVLRIALSLMDPSLSASEDLITLIAACQGEPDAVAHARSLLNMAVAAQPPERRRRRRSAPAEAAS